MLDFSIEDRSCSVSFQPKMIESLEQDVGSSLTQSSKIKFKKNRPTRSGIPGIPGMSGKKFGALEIHVIPSSAFAPEEWGNESGVQKSHLKNGGLMLGEYISDTSSKVIKFNYLSLEENGNYFLTELISGLAPLGNEITSLERLLVDSFDDDSVVPYNKVSDDNDALERGGEDGRDIFLSDYSDEYSEEQKKFQEMARSFWDVQRTERAIQSVNGLEKLRDQIVGLARLTPDWYGEGSVVPKQELINDFMQALASLPYNVKMPEIEVDDDGSVSLEWGAQDGSASFALDCSGTGNIVGTLLSKDRSQQQAWRLKVNDYNNLANKLDMPIISQLLVGEL